MKAWEMIFYLEQSWTLLRLGEPLDDSLKGILKAMAWQSSIERMDASTRIAKCDGYTNEFIEHAARFLQVKIKYQRRLF